MKTKQTNPGPPEQLLRKRRTCQPVGPIPIVFLWVYSTHFKARSGRYLIYHSATPPTTAEKP